jgi:2-polyprenyl-3-methyl-5-hydroxy-6-metoxy-1,4-benzoquinol methylase
METALGGNEDIRTEEAKYCLMCNNEGVVFYQDLQDRLFGVPGTWSFMRCAKCGLIWLNPRPVISDIWKLYKSYHCKLQATEYIACSALQIVIWNAVLAACLSYNSLVKSSLQKEMGKLLSLIPLIREKCELSVMTLSQQRVGKLLDIGCGTGLFLARMQRLGWSVMGVEPDSTGARIAQECYGLEVFQGTLEDAHFPEGTFDVVTMNHVIEHVHNPIVILSECWRVLKNGGIIVVTTPNIESLAHKIFKHCWFDLDPPRHLYLYNPHTLARLFERAGFTSIQIRSVTRNAYSRFLFSLSLLKGNKIVSFSTASYRVMEKIAAITFWVFESFCNYLFPNTGEELLLIATK